jgi:hypothetical protein
MKPSKSSARLQKPSLSERAIGPAVDEFGKEFSSVGKEVGALGVRAARALLSPVGALIWGFEKVETWIAKAVAPKVAAIPEEFRVQPKVTIAGPAIDSMKYCGSEPQLRDLFANLLATSMDSRTRDQAHPAFVELIRQLSPDEAKILKYIVKRRYREYFAVIEVRRSFVAIGARNERNQPQTIKVFGPYSTIGYHAGCDRLNTLPSLLHNLIRLGIMQLEFPCGIDARLLQELLDDELITAKKAEIEAWGTAAEKDRFAYETGVLELTAFGEQFLDACVRERNS